VYDAGMQGHALADRIDRELAARVREGAAGMHATRRAVSAEIADWPAADVIALGHALVERGRRFVGCDLVRCHPGALGALRVRDVERFGAGMDGWHETDAFGAVAGPAWRAGRISDARVARWARSTDRWWRRAALVATTWLNTRARGGVGDAARTLGVCALLVDDRDDMVVKGMSWALRELAARDGEAVGSFLARHGAALAPRVRREVANKLRTGRKTPPVSEPASRPAHPAQRRMR